jgi:A/G-specific adenine glycosylase
LSWFGQNARDLPWRHSRDPYGIWVSEVMLQQTQVQTVIPYWNRWMTALPTLQDLAGVPEDRLLKLWEGLGYYSRVRNLQRAARAVMHQYHGRIPSQRPTLLELPGVGPYTAGAIASLAFNQPEPLVDGNVARVLSRLNRIEGDPRDSAPRDQLWQLAQGLVTAAGELKSVPSTPMAAGRYSALNQGLMELGATVCLPRNPTCLLCPVSGQCQAHRTGEVDRYPMVRPRVKATRVRYLVAVVTHAGKWWMRKRNVGEVNQGLWEFPQLEVTDDPREASISARNWLGVPESQLIPLPRIRHAITRYQITLDVFMVSLKRIPDVIQDGEWVTSEEVGELALTAAHRKIAGSLLARHN